MQVWLQHTSDPLIAPDAQEVIGALASHSSCLPSLVQAAAPTLAAILQRGAARRLAKQQGQPLSAAAAGSEALPDESPMLVEASLDLLGALVQPGHEATTMEVSWGVNAACRAPAMQRIDCCHQTSHKSKFPMSNSSFKYSSNTD
jgi:hypothetical protein